MRKPCTIGLNFVERCRWRSWFTIPLNTSLVTVLRALTCLYSNLNYKGIFSLPKAGGWRNFFLPTPRIKSAPRSWGTYPPSPSPSLDWWLKERLILHLDHCLTTLRQKNNAYEGKHCISIIVKSQFYRGSYLIRTESMWMWRMWMCAYINKSTRWIAMLRWGWVFLERMQILSGV